MMLKYHLTVVKVTIFVSAICCVCSQDMTFPKEYSVFQQNLSLLTNFWYNFDNINHYTKTIVVLEGHRNNSMSPEVANSLSDFQNELIIYLNREHSLPLLLIRLSTLSDVSRIREILKTISKEIFVIVFGNLEALRASIERPMTIYIKYNRAHFIIAVTITELSTVSCGDGAITEKLKEIFGEYFVLFWITFKMFEVIVILPFLCGREFVIKYNFIKIIDEVNYLDAITVITKETFSTGTSLHYKYKNFNGYPLRINLFMRMPTAVKNMPLPFMDTYLRNDIKDIGNVGGLDGFLTGNLVKIMNFTPIIQPPTDDGEYGYFINGTFTGSLGDIISKRMDISLNARFLKTYYNSQDIELTRPVYYDQFCVLAPKAQRIPQWMSILLIFEPDVWLLIFISAVWSGFVWWFMKTRFPQKDEVINNPMSFYFIDICLIYISYPIRLPSEYKQRLFIWLCLMFNLIVAGVFQGQLSTAYSTTSYYKDINTLQQLDQSGLKVATSNTDFFGLNVSRVGDSLSKKIVKSDPSTSKKAAEERNIAVVERRTDATSLIELYFTNRFGEEQLHIVDQCPRTYHLSYIVYKGFPFLNQINDFMVRIFDAGLSTQWYHITEFSVLLKERMQRTDGEVERKLTILDVQTSFMFLFIGYITSAIVFVYEIIIFRWEPNSHLKISTVVANAQPHPFVF